jgi:predicted transcriptional regulator
MVPNILIEKQHALGLTPQDLNVLLVLLKYWWKADDLPFPSKATIAEYMDVAPRTVQRSITRLRKWELIETRKRPGTTGTNEYSFQGLIRKLTPDARAALKQLEEQKAQRRQQRLRKQARATFRNEDDE